MGMLFRCKNCGGNVVYSPEHAKMFCPHCDGIDSENREVNQNHTDCVNCGAPLTIGEYNSTCKCEYCDSYIILDERVEGDYKPDLVLPFKLGMKQAVEKMKKEFKRRVFTPDTFLSESTLKDMQGMYVPFWMYDYEASCDYVGKGTKVRTWRSGDTEYTETSFYRIERNIDMDFEKIPVDASEKMQDDVMDLIEPFDYEQLEDFQEKYMSGFYGEVYNLPADQLESRAKQKAAEDAEILLKETLGGYTTVTAERNDKNIRRNGLHYALLPVWKYIYKYQEKEYEFYVNGQTGKVIGSTPVSQKKVIAYGCTVFAGVWMGLTLLQKILEVL